MALLRRYRPGAILVRHIPTNGDRRTASPALREPTEPSSLVVAISVDIRGVVELKQVQLAALQSLASGIPGLSTSASQFSIRTHGICNDDKPLGSPTILGSQFSLTYSLRQYRLIQCLAVDELPVESTPASRTSSSTLWKAKRV